MELRHDYWVKGGYRWVACSSTEFETWPQMVQTAHYSVHCSVSIEQAVLVAEATQHIAKVKGHTATFPNNGTIFHIFQGVYSASSTGLVTRSCLKILEKL